MGRRIISLSVLFLILQGFGTFAADHEPVSVVALGQKVVSEDEHFIEDGRVYVLAREVAEALGSEVDWVDEGQEVILTRGERRVIFNIASFTASVDGQVRTMDALPRLIGGRAYLPVRYLSEFLGFQVEWVADSRLVKIEENENQDSRIHSEADSYSKEDLLWLSRIVQVETGGNSAEMMLAVANVVLNRVESPLFPDSIHDVIFQVDVHTQFPPAHMSSFLDLIPGDLAIGMSRRALEGENNIKTALYFNNAPFRSKADDLFKVIDGEYFYN